MSIVLIADCSMVDVIGSIVISLSRCCLPNEEGPALPPNIFPGTAPVTTTTEKHCDDVSVSDCCRRGRMFSRVGHGSGPGGRSCPSPGGCLMQLARHARRRQPRDCDSRQPGDDPTNVVTGPQANCCTSVRYSPRINLCPAHVGALGIL